MFPRSFFLAAAFATMTGLPVIAQPLEVSTLEVSRADSTTLPPKVLAPNYITDVSGKRFVWSGRVFIPTVRGRWSFPVEN